jgi:prepilin-type N-terminal cleavage/methylation domain-containing protein
MKMNMRMKTSGRSANSQAGFSLLEMVIVCAILTIVLASIFNGINTSIQRSQAEQVKVGLVQEGREFIDEFERDLHQAGYPNCRMVSVSNLNCPADSTNTTVANSSSVAAGIAYLDNTKIIFEGDVDGNGTVDSIQYALIDSAGNNPPTGSCPCSIRRSQIAKANGTPPGTQTPIWTQELQNVVNSGQPTGTNPYGGGVSISGNTAWGATNTSYYAAISSFKDYPVFQAFDQYGNIIQINPGLDLTTTTNSQILNCQSTNSNCVKTIRITLNLLGDATTGVDQQTKVRPVTTLVGDARLVNN